MKLLVGCCLFGAALGYAAFDGEDPATAAAKPIVTTIEDPLVSQAMAAASELPYGPALPPNFVCPTPEEIELGVDTNAAHDPAELLVPEAVESIVHEILGQDSQNLSAIDVLARDVERLRQELNATVGQGPDTQSALLDIEGYDKELDDLGVRGDLANEIRSLYPEVQSLRGELMLLDLRTQKSETEFKPVKPLSETDVATEPVAASDAPGAVATRVLSKTLPRTDFPKLEAMLRFANGDKDGSAEILSRLPDGELDPSARFALGASFVSQRRFSEARAVLKSLLEDTARPVLAEAAARQMKRMEMIEAGLVGLDPLVKQIQEDAK